MSPRYTVAGIFDDRNRVVDMWRRLGLACFQVAEGDF
ncbi:phosphatase domain-containing protein [Mycolicibacterium conceptionense]